ncbi:hypothetical protein Tco_0401743 [Tanacetum coccineum]
MLFRMIKKLPVMVDVAHGSRLGAWLRACCLFIMPSKSGGMSANVAWGHGGDGGGDDRPPQRQYLRLSRVKNFWIIVREPENPTGEVGKLADSIPAGKPGISS